MNIYGWLRSLLPEIVSSSRKGLIWFTTGGCAALLELLKGVGPMMGWAPETIELISTKLLTIQVGALAIAAFWTSQIAKEDAALKTGLPPPADANPIDHEIKH
jgi:hypothetical protein